MANVMTPTAVDSLLAAPKSKLDSWTRTIRNGIEAARADGRTRYIGGTSMAYYVETERPLQGLQYVAHGDGTVERI